MELVRGIAQNVRNLAPATEQEKPGFVSLELNGRVVRLDMPPEACPWPVHDGDDIIVAGDLQAETLVGYAYKDVTQAYVSRASCRSEAVYGWLTLLMAVASLWYAWQADSDIALCFWTQRIIFLVMALLFALGTLAYIIAMAEKFRAAFLVVSTSLETVKGVARHVEHTPQGAGTRIELDGRRIDLLMARAAAIREGDEVVVAGEPAGEVLSALIYRNITRSALGRAWSRAGMILTPVLLILIAAGLTGLWSNGEDLDIAIALRRLLALGIAMGLVLFALDRFFRWRLYSEAYRRVKQA
jgi:hypothetical protein